MRPCILARGHADISTRANIYVQGSPAELEAKLRKVYGERVLTTILFDSRSRDSNRKSRISGENGGGGFR